MIPVQRKLASPETYRLFKSQLEAIEVEVENENKKGNEISKQAVMRHIVDFYFDHKDSLTQNKTGEKF